MSNPLNEFEQQREKGLKMKALHDAELEEYGEPHPYTGQRMTRPKSTGTVYDIPPNNGTYCADQVDYSGASATDLNAVMRRVDPSGKLFNRALKDGLVTDAGMRYDDFTTAQSYEEAMSTVTHATQQFELLPVELRNRFENNPAKFFNYIHDPNFQEEQYNLGIRIRPEKKEPQTELKDVVTAIRETANTASKGKKGVKDDE